MMASPFSKSKFEHDGNHLYFLNRDILQMLEGDVPILIHGSRGTGKTTLLNSLNWKEQRKNKSLIEALIKIESRKDYIGIYVKVPELKIGAMKKWETEKPDIYKYIFSYYLELVWLEELVRSINSMAVNGEIAISALKEKTFVHAINNGNVISKLATNNPKTFLDLCDSFRCIRKYIEDASLYEEPINNVYSSIGRVEQIGSLGSNICEEITKLIGNNSEGCSYKFKVCMDECECLSETQILVVNTLVRLSRFPVLYVFSFVRKPQDFTTTFVENITNQKADIQLINLDELSNFKDFTEGVATVRIKDGLKDDSIVFSLKTILGQISINSMLTLVLGKSVSSNVRELLKKAEENRNNQFYEFYKDETLPIYQTYLVDKLNINIENSVKEKWQKRAQESKEIRKRMVGAYLSICAEFGQEPIYGSMDMMLGMCDNSIRDFLWQLDEIFKASKRDIKTFATSTVPINIQNAGIKKSSEKKFKSIPQAPVNSPGGVGRLVYGLAKLTSIIQTTSNDLSHLKSSERGIFNLKITNCKRGHNLAELITQGAESGFLRVIETADDIIRFRVHTSLAPAFKFSYRGAYYDTRIEAHHIERMLATQDKNELDLVTKEIATLIYNLGDQKQLTISGLL
jgi:hypothetical protein